jgi:DNA modification methylase
VETSGLADIFPYYAGFSYDWARSQLAAQDLRPSSIVLDPWNGSGTTTLAALANGHRTVGVDLNPIANVVARLRVQVRPGEVPLMPAPGREHKAAVVDEPLAAWFETRTAARFRQWADSLKLHPSAVSTLATVALFRVVRRLTSAFEGSNPTWVRRTNDESLAVAIDTAELDCLLITEQEFIRDRLVSQAASMVPSVLITASATNLPLSDGSIDAVLTSPPYLTRIDYAVAYSRELAVLGIDIKRDRELRRGLMGTTLTRSNALAGRLEYGPTASDLVKRVAEHPSKASGGYYLKQVRQYLDDLLGSLDELTRVASDSATMQLVVQDSYYKDIPVALAQICTEEAELRGWIESDGPNVFEVKRFLTQLNTAARAYSKGKVSETVITLRRN